MRAVYNNSLVPNSRGCNEEGVSMFAKNTYLGGILIIGGSMFNTVWRPKHFRIIAVGC